jgi:hypothetical protein
MLALFPANPPLPGSHDGGHDAVRGPVAGTPLGFRDELADAGLSAKTMPPFVAVLLASAKADEPIPALKGHG